MAHHGPPVAPAPRQVVSRQRWLAARNSEQRQRESAKRAGADADAAARQEDGGWDG